MAAHPDLVHFQHIRTALNRGHAAVMTGSGFSKNAENGHLMSDWPTLAARLVERIYVDDDDQARTKTQTVAISGMLRLAREFEAVLGRAELDQPSSQRYVRRASLRKRPPPLAIPYGLAAGLAVWACRAVSGMASTLFELELSMYSKVYSFAVGSSWNPSDAPKQKTPQA